MVQVGTTTNAVNFPFRLDIAFGEDRKTRRKKKKTRKETVRSIIFPSISERSMRGRL